MYVIVFQEMNKLPLHGLKYGCTNPKCSRSSGPSASPCLSGHIGARGARDTMHGSLPHRMVSMGKHTNIPLKIGYSQLGRWRRPAGLGRALHGRCISLGTKRWDEMHQ